VDYCKALAIAILGDATKVRYVPTTAQVRFTALQSGEVDVLSRNTTWTLSRDTSLGFDFGATNFFDGQGFMVKRSLGVQNARQLDGATVCVQPGTTTEQNLADWARGARIQIRPVVIEAWQHAARCRGCGARTKGAYPAGLEPARTFGPCLTLSIQAPARPAASRTASPSAAATSWASWRGSPRCSNNTAPTSCASRPASWGRRRADSM